MISKKKELQHWLPRGNAPLLNEGVFNILIILWQLLSFFGATKLKRGSIQFRFIKA